MATTRQWWGRLVNAYEVKAGMVCLQLKNVWSIPERFSSEFLTMGRYLYLNELVYYFNISSIIFSNIMFAWKHVAEQYRFVVVSSSGPCPVTGFCSGLQLFTISSWWGTYLLEYSENVHGILSRGTPRGLWGHLCRLHRTRHSQIRSS